MKKWGCLIVCLSLLQQARLQQPDVYPTVFKSTDSLRGAFSDSTATNYPRRQKTVAALSISAAAGSLVLLNEAWYKQYPRTGLHAFNDSHEWLQMDKVGHATTAYLAGKYTAALWQWAGVNPRKAVLLGSASSLGYMTIIEWLDGHTQKWGWSWADIGANTAGTLLFAAQQLGWNEQKLLLKFSAFPARYPAALQARANDLFGKTLPERLLKDYNAQTYWLSINLNAVQENGLLPPWLNIALGYGAAGLWGGFENKAYDKEGNLVFDRRDIPRRRQWYLSPDVDFSRIKTGRKGIRVLLQALNCFKFPAPTLLLENGKIRGRFIAF